MLTKFLLSNAKSLVGSELKGSVKNLISKFKEKSKEEIDKEIISKIGYSTHHFKLNKNQEVVFTPSSVFFNEWLSNSPLIKQPLTRDEETGQTYYGEKIINSSLKKELIDLFSKNTGITNSSLVSHFDGAIKLIEVSDYNSKKFKDYFSGWDSSNESVIDTWISSVFPNNKFTNLEFSQKLFRKWIIGTAKRAISPGAPLDGCLVLKGPGAIGKTSFFRNILPNPFDNRTGEILCNVKNAQKFVENILGKTVACFDELSVLEFQRSTETLKQLLSSQFIDVRLPYRRDPQHYLLRQGFCGTTNKNNFIKDPFLSRRLWVIEITSDERANFDYLISNRDMLWKEAVYCALNNEKYLLSKEEQVELESLNKNYLLV